MEKKLKVTIIVNGTGHTRLAYNTCGDGAKETSLVLLMLSNIKFELLLGQASISMMSNIKFDAYMLHCKRKSSRRSLF